MKEKLLDKFYKKHSEQFFQVLYAEDENDRRKNLIAYTDALYAYLFSAFDE